MKKTSLKNNNKRVLKKTDFNTILDIDNVDSIVDKGDEIFKAYDIRGLYDSELDEGIAYLIGRAFVLYTKARKIVVGHDARNSSLSLTNALVRGIVDQGADVINIGFSSTPLFYFSVQKYDAGIMVTASHNPKEYNGFKLCGENASPISMGSGLEIIKDIVFNKLFDDSINSSPTFFPIKKGVIKNKSFLKEFIFLSKSFLKTNNHFKIVVDAGNGMGGLIYGTLKKIGFNNIDLIPLYFELNGDFPNHIANPVDEKTLVDLKKKVVEENADLGLAIDGDGDRVIFIDEKGESVSPDLTGSLIVKYILKKNNFIKKITKNKFIGNFINKLTQKSIVYTVINSRIFIDSIISAGGIPIESPVGHSFIKQLMRKHNSLYSVELSGHNYFKEMNYCESTIIALSKLLNILSKENKSLSELIMPLKKYVTIRENNFRLKNRDQGLKIINNIKKKYSDGKINELDGIKVVYDNWWFSIRLSNTEPLLRLNIEADNKKILDKELKRLKSFIKV